MSTRGTLPHLILYGPPVTVGAVEQNVFLVFLERYVFIPEGCVVLQSDHYPLAGIMCHLSKKTQNNFLSEKHDCKCYGAVLHVFLHRKSRYLVWRDGSVMLKSRFASQIQPTMSKDELCMISSQNAYKSDIQRPFSPRYVGEIISVLRQI